MNTNTNDSGWTDQLKEAERRLHTAQGSILTLSNERQRHITVLTVIAHAKTLDEAHKLAHEALGN